MSHDRFSKTVVFHYLMRLSFPTFVNVLRASNSTTLFSDLDKTMQRFLRKPLRVTLATLLGVYRAVMRLSSIAGALENAFEDSNQDQDGIEEKSGPQLLRQRLILPLRQVRDSRRC